MDVTAFELKLVDTPKDDWILDTPPVIDFGKQCCSADGFHRGQQVINYLVKKYRADLARAHAFRYFIIKEFYIKHLDRLHRKKLVEGEGRQLVTREALLHAIAIVPFSEECTRAGKPSRRMNFLEVTNVAEALKPE